MNETTARPCPKWCDYSDARKHPPVHIAHLGDLVASSVRSRTEIVAVTVECGLGERVPHPVLAMLADDAAPSSVRLTWSEAGHVARLLFDAGRKYA